MVLVTVLKEAIKFGIKYGSRYYAAEGKAFNKLYRGFPQSKTIGRGVRHGLVAGSVGGSFINQAPDTPGNGIQAPFESKYPASSSYKARRGQSVRYRSRRKNRYCVSYRKGRSRSSQRY